MTTIADIDRLNGLYLPANEDEIKILIQHANENNLCIRVRGSGHSVDGAIFTDTTYIDPDDNLPTAADPNINIYLSKMTDVHIYEENGTPYVRVQGGCHLGRDPRDPTNTSTEANSLFAQLDAQGLAVKDMGGIIHQTVAGFLSTGSAGGSIKASLASEIMEIRLIDGTGETHVFKRDDDDETFNAVGVSLGLMGIITEVVFRCVENYTIHGSETTYTYDSLPMDLFGDQPHKVSAEQWFRDTLHARLYWWSQQGVDKVVVWEADIAEQPAPPPEVWQAREKPYEEFPVLFGKQSNLPLKTLEIPAEYISRLLFLFFSPLTQPEPTFFLWKIRNRILKALFAPAVNAFITGEETQPQTFYDIWYRGLPMDNKVNYEILPVEFTELWVKLSDTPAVMSTLRDYFREHGFPATGTTTIELYATEHVPFWMSAAHGDSPADDVLKIDMFWFGDNPGDPGEIFYPQFWELLKPYNYRPHWGKMQPINPAYLRQQYPRWDDFMAQRREMDPNQIFVTDYWRDRLGIPKPKAKHDS